MLIWRHRQILWRRQILFLLSSLVTGPSFMSISSLVLELWQFSFIRDWPKIRKSEIPPSVFCPVSGDWSKLGIPNLAWMSLMKCYWIIQKARVTAYTVSELLGENQQRVNLPPTQIRVNYWLTTLISNEWHGWYWRGELTLSWRWSVAYRNQSNDLQSKSMNWFLYDRDHRHERVIQDVTSKIIISVWKNEQVS